MVAILGHVRLVDEVVVYDKVRIPLVGLATQEAVEPVEALLPGPLRPVPAGGNVLIGTLWFLPSQNVLQPASWRIWQTVAHWAGIRPAAPGKPLEPSVIDGEAVEVVVAAGQECGPGG